jgi:hypothetical protein
MEIQFEKNAGIALIVFTLLMVFTIVLHPAGGSFEHLLKITTMIIVSHSIAILSLPLAALGFWGLTKKIGDRYFLSLLAFAFICLGLITALMAAATNGLVLPLFIQKFKDATPDLKYNTAVNNAFDYIYSAALCIAMLLWSIAILQYKKLPVWLGWLGIAVCIFTVLLVVGGYALSSLQGLRFFVSGMVLWIFSAGILLSYSGKQS